MPNLLDQHSLFEDGSEALTGEVSRVVSKTKR